MSFLNYIFKENYWIIQMLLPKDCSFVGVLEVTTRFIAAARVLSCGLHSSTVNLLVVFVFSSGSSIFASL
jgi:hypothetical protein